MFAEEVEPTGAVPIEMSLERYRYAALPNKFREMSDDQRLQPRVMLKFFSGSHILSQVNKILTYSKSIFHRITRPKNKTVFHCLVPGQNSSAAGAEPMVRQRETVLETGLQSVHRRVFRRIVSQALWHRFAYIRFSIGNYHEEYKIRIYTSIWIMMVKYTGMLARYLNYTITAHFSLVLAILRPISSCYQLIVR